MSKYFRYHKGHSHDTDHCWKLKKEIEKLIQRGLLSQFVGKNDERPPRDQGKKDVEEILMIGGRSLYSRSSNGARKAYARRVQTSHARIEMFYFIPAKQPRTEELYLTFINEDLDGCRTLT